MKKAAAIIIFAIFAIAGTVYLFTATTVGGTKRLESLLGDMTTAYKSGGYDLASKYFTDAGLESVSEESLKVISDESTTMRIDEQDGDNASITIYMWGPVSSSKPIKAQALKVNGKWYFDSID